MKRKILGGLLVAFIAALAAFNTNFNMNKDDSLSAISLANVEALAQGESGPGLSCRANPVEGPAHAYLPELSCATCSYRPLKSWSGMGTCRN